jgi:ATP-dependent Clp protease protease subunit
MITACSVVGGIIFSVNQPVMVDNETPDLTDSLIFSRMAVTNSLISKLPKKQKQKTGTPIESLDKRLSLISH